MNKGGPQSRSTGIGSLLVSISALIAIVSVLSLPAVAQSLDDFRLADGYGLLVEIDGAKMSTSQITSISCVPWWTAKRSDAGVSKTDVVFNRGDADIRLTQAHHRTRSSCARGLPYRG